MDGRIRYPGRRRTSRDLRSQQTAPTLDNIVRTGAACQIPLFFVEKCFLFNSLAIPFKESPLDIICLIILITSCSFYSFKFTDFIVVSKMDLALVSNSFSCVFIMNSYCLKHWITIKWLTCICLAISLIGRSYLLYRLEAYDLLRNSVFEGN